MAMTKAKGNMYDWVTHTHAHLAGQCANQCSYCYVQAMEKRFRTGKYSGETHLIEKELHINYGKGRKIFIEHCNDLCSDGVADDWIRQIMAHCNAYPDNHYVFQTRDPGRLFFLEGCTMPPLFTVGTTLETDYSLLSKVLSYAPTPQERINGLQRWRSICETYITIEPIMQFSLDGLMKLILTANPTWINIGADSKKTNLPEPSRTDVISLIDALQSAGIEIRKKSNLARILGE
jgi:DNA repair photolyase